jgi:hypothetical protein
VRFLISDSRSARTGPPRAVAFYWGLTGQDFSGVAAEYFAPARGTRASRRPEEMKGLNNLKELKGFVFRFFRNFLARGNSGDR